MLQRAAALGLAFAVLLTAGPRAGAATEIVDTPLLPPGIIISETRQGPVLATKEGMTIYKKLPRIAGWGHAANQAEVIGQCVYGCPSEWPPVKAPADAKPVGDFTIVSGPDGVRQWAFKGVPLQTFIFDKEPGHTLGEDTYAFNGPRVPIGEAAWLESEIGPQKPPDPPAPTTDLPPGVTVQLGTAGNRYFATAQGLTLYAYDSGSKAAPCTGRCLDQWRPFPAGALVRPIGDWAASADEGGTRQWTHKGRPVYAYVKDSTPGEPTGDGLDGKWHALVEYQAPLPAEITVRDTETVPVFAERRTGKTLYYPGFNHRPYQTLGFNHKGFLYGTVSCYNECAKLYPPLLASADAKPVGEWWIITRVDGTKQWGYRGVPVYTYGGDEPGRHLASYKAHIWTEAVANNH